MSTRIAATVGRPSKSRKRNVPCYARLVKGEDARERIRKLLVTGDNRLKQGVDPEKARKSWEQALAVAVEAGLEGTVRPPAEIRLAELESLPRDRGSPPAPPPGGAPRPPPP